MVLGSMRLVMCLGVARTLQTLRGCLDVRLSVSHSSLQTSQAREAVKSSQGEQLRAQRDQFMQAGCRR